MAAGAKARAASPEMTVVLKSACLKAMSCQTPERDFVDLTFVGARAVVLLNKNLLLVRSPPEAGSQFL
jgi:hypothetical protein